MNNSLTFFFSSVLIVNSFVDVKAAQMDGEWIAISKVRAGVQKAEEPSFAIIRNGSFSTERNGSLTEIGSISEDAKQTPSQYTVKLTGDVEDPSQEYKGIFALNGDTLITCVNPDPNGPRPTSFASTKDNGHILICWMRNEKAQILYTLRRQYYLGVLTYPTTKGYRIRHVTPGSPAYQANLRRGDYIKSVDGVPVGYLKGDFYRPLVAALNSTNGKARLEVHFSVPHANELRKYTPEIELTKRGTTTYAPTGLESEVLPDTTANSTADNQEVVLELEAELLSAEDNDDAYAQRDTRKDRDARGTVIEKLLKAPQPAFEKSEQEPTE